ncbi:MAG: hypothetical protein EON59_06855 [Alphaproteobacteria bacterium]|nr:MAG: hypothetical protein EON59_06855 [Alphaproteobacteria bacterium]
MRKGQNFLTQAQCDRARRLEETYGGGLACEMMGISSSTLWALKRRGFKAIARPLRKMPTDFAIIADGRNSEWLRAHYGTSNRSIARWRRESGAAEAKAGIPALPIPSDFLAIVDSLGANGAAVHFGVSKTTITKWKRAHGLRLRRDPKPAPVGIGWIEQRYARPMAKTA